MINPNILLKGLDGSNPLAFLAALGTLRTLTLALPDETVKMSWVQYEGAWRPCLRCLLVGDNDALIQKLDESLVRNRTLHPTRFIDYSSSNKEAAEFYQVIRDGGSVKQELDAWISSLTNDVYPEATSPLQLTRSDYFVGNLDQVMANTSADHLRKALLHTWRYDDALSGQSLHLEPNEDRRHAYQWNQPSGDPNRNKSGNMLGANRLAVEAFPLFLGLPSNNPSRLLMTGWKGIRSDDSTWTWPIWTTPIPLEVVKSTLLLPELQETKPSSDLLTSVGICSVYRCRRFMFEKTKNLSPSVSLF